MLALEKKKFAIFKKIIVVHMMVTVNLVKETDLTEKQKNRQIFRATCQDKG